MAKGFGHDERWGGTRAEQRCSLSVVIPPTQGRGEQWRNWKLFSIEIRQRDCRTGIFVADLSNINCQQNGQLKAKRRNCTRVDVDCSDPTKRRSLSFSKADCLSDRVGL